MTHTSAAKKSDIRMTLVLVLVVAAAIAIALATTRTSRGAGVLVSERSPPPSLAVESPEPPAAQDGAVSGDVLEVVPVNKYTYLRLRGFEGEVWAAVPSAAVAIGSRVTLLNATRMDDFKSATLGRSFKVIYFGTLAAPAAAAVATSDGSAPKFPIGDEQAVDSDPQLPPGHPELADSAAGALADGSNPLPTGHPDIGGNAASSVSPHGKASDAPGASEPLPPMPKIARAAGSNGHVIAELAVERHQLAGQSVRVRGQVTKVTPDIRGRAFFHLRDGSASGNGPATDLVVTSAAPPKPGQVATFEGTLRADEDIGIGYRYPVLLDDAALQDE